MEGINSEFKRRYDCCIQLSCPQILFFIHCFCFILVLFEWWVNIKKAPDEINRLMLSSVLLNCLLFLFRLLTSGY